VARAEGGDILDIPVDEATIELYGICWNHEGKGRIQSAALT
jgi:hypothetical protein